MDGGDLDFAGFLGLGTALDYASYGKLPDVFLGSPAALNTAAVAPAAPAPTLKRLRIEEPVEQSPAALAHGDPGPRRRGRATEVPASSQPPTETLDSALAHADVDGVADAMEPPTVSDAPGAEVLLDDAQLSAAVRRISDDLAETNTESVRLTIVVLGLAGAQHLLDETQAVEVRTVTSSFLGCHCPQTCPIHSSNRHSTGSGRSSHG